MTVYFGDNMDFTATPQEEQLAFEVVGTEDDVPRIEITGARYAPKTNWAAVLGVFAVAGILYVSTRSTR